MSFFKEIIEEESKKEYYIKLKKYIDSEYEKSVVYPKKENIFSSLSHTPYENIKVVIIGQDPYHGENEAHGLAFSVNKGIKIPPSLKNIYKELNEELNTYIPNNGYLVKWASQGVLMLNSVLTVRKDTPASHRNVGWEIFTDRIIEEINKKEKGVVFMLWGNYAKQKEILITNKEHLILKAAHPSPFSCHNGFFGCGHFKKANEFLEQNNIKKIDWQIENI